MTQRRHHASQIARALLQQLIDVAKECTLLPWEVVHAVHVVDSLGQADDAYQDLATPTFVLRRKHLKRRYADDLMRLEEGPMRVLWDGSASDERRRCEAKAWLSDLEELEGRQRYTIGAHCPQGVTAQDDRERARTQGVWASLDRGTCVGP